MRRLIQFGRDEKLERITATILPENTAMRALAASQGFVVEKTADLDAVHIAVSL